MYPYPVTRAFTSREFQVIALIESGDTAGLTSLQLTGLELRQLYGVTKGRLIQFANEKQGQRLVNYLFDLGMTAFGINEWAIICDKPEVISASLHKLLISEIYNLLITAAKHNRFAIIPLLLNAPQPRTQVNYPTSVRCDAIAEALCAAAEFGYQETITLILQQPSINDQMIRLAIIAASKNSHPNKITMICKLASALSEFSVHPTEKMLSAIPAMENKLKWELLQVCLETYIKKLTDESKRAFHAEQNSLFKSLTLYKTEKPQPERDGLISFLNEPLTSISLVESAKGLLESVKRNEVHLSFGRTPELRYFCSQFQTLLNHFNEPINRFMKSMG